MSGYEVCVAVLMIGALPAALFLAFQGRPVDQLIGVEMAGAVITVAMLLVAQVTGQSYDLIVPLVLVVLAAAGTLVFTRLIGRSADDS